MTPRLAAALPDAGILGPADVTSDRLSDLPAVGAQRAGRLLSAFLSVQPAYELAELFVPAGVAVRLAGRAFDRLGPPAPRLVRDDPWLLMSVPGIGPDEADRVARVALPGVRRDDPRRSRAMVGHLLSLEARDGHTVTPRSLVEDGLLGLGAADDPRAAVQAALDGGTVVDLGPRDDPLLSPARLAEAEDAVAEGIARLLATAEPIEVPAASRRAGDAELDDVQRSAVDAALAGGVSVLTGGPGTGKSRTVATLVALATAAGCSVALAAPTGRAAKRLEQLCDAPASTLHRLLGAQPREGAWGSGAGFTRNEEFPIEADVVVVDETSMLDVELAEALLAACADGTHLLLVGDAAQLPSIGAGRVLGDVIDAGVVPVTELARLYRQADGGAIARLATAIRGGALPAVDDPTREVVIVPARDADDAAHRVVQLVTDSIPRALGIPAEQVQVVTPVHRGGAGTQALNAALKARLNPGGGGTRRFDPGDRVVATANHFEAEPVGFANGEVGVVEDVGDQGAVTVQFASGPARVKGTALADVTHGWAVTVHRAQGSEFPAVVVVLPPEAGRMLSRPLVYTAVTRAQRHLSVVHAAGPAVARAVERIGALPRRTRLAAALAAAVSGAGQR